MTPTFVLFPNQLFQHVEKYKGNQVILIEEHLFFAQFKFHKQKIAFQRASMQFYKSYLSQQEIYCQYIDSQDKKSDIREFLKAFTTVQKSELIFIDPVDNWLKKRITLSCEKLEIQYSFIQNPAFLNTAKDNESFFRTDKKRLFHHDFYTQQRRRLNVLMENDSPKGGKWSFDEENRKKYPKNKTAPKPIQLPKNDFDKEAEEYVSKHFDSNYGELNTKYPTSFDEAQLWFHDFLSNRLRDFGEFEDAIVSDQNILHHSLLTPLLNTGLLNPKDVLQELITYSEANQIPLNSIEGIVRQLIGWREFIRGTYESVGTIERTTNFWNFDRKIPKSFYLGTTGISPIDDVIKKVLKTGYCHHIERLMVLGNFMLLCEFDPDEVYRWFMELFIDAYDWVMVPNVYGMSQFADGGLMATKPYISGSNYLLKMSDYKKEPWSATWDGLFWSFMDTHRDFFNSNPRIGMLVKMYDKMDESKKAAHKDQAIIFLESLV